MLVPSTPIFTVPRPAGAALPVVVVVAAFLVVFGATFLVVSFFLTLAAATGAPATDDKSASAAMTATPRRTRVLAPCDIDCPPLRRSTRPSLATYGEPDDPARAISAWLGRAMSAMPWLGASSQPSVAS